MRHYIFSGVIAVALLGIYYVSTLNAQETVEQTEIYEQLDIFGDAFEKIRNNYVEPVDAETLIEAAINGMLVALDPHSSYVPPREMDEMEILTRGQFGGLGIEITQDDGFVKVITPLDGTPAHAAGIQAGDYITHVDGASLLGMTLKDAVELMRGPIGADVVITVVRKDTPEPFDVLITRDTIKLRAVTGKLEGDAIYLRVASFTDQTSPDLEKRFNEVLEEAGGFDNITGIVLDLRNNPGGLLNEAIAVSDAFLDQGEIVSTRGRHERNSARVNSRPGDISMGKPIAILINEGSASASEIVAGALQDHKRAVIIGTQSFGKGSVQTITPLYAQNSALRLTTARYYTPSGRSIQKLGITPDIIVNQPQNTITENEEKKGNRSEADLRGALSNDSLSEEEYLALEAEREKAEAMIALRVQDYQLAYAIDVLQGIATIQK